MSNTENKIYLTFAEVVGQHKLDSIMAQQPYPIEFSSDNFGVGNKYHVSQSIEIKKDATPDEIKEAINPANYEFVFLNEDIQKVAVLVGLDLSTIQYPLN